MLNSIKTRTCKTGSVSAVILESSLPPPIGVVSKFWLKIAGKWLWRGKRVSQMTLVISNMASTGSVWPKSACLKLTRLKWALEQVKTMISQPELCLLFRKKAWISQQTQNSKSLWKHWQRKLSLFVTSGLRLRKQLRKRLELPARASRQVWISTRWKSAGSLRERKATTKTWGKRLERRVAPREIASLKKSECYDMSLKREQRIMIGTMSSQYNQRRKKTIRWNSNSIWKPSSNLPKSSMFRVIKALVLQMVQDSRDFLSRKSKRCWGKRSMVRARNVKWRT